jgi:two-component system LytT family response regulator
MTTRETLRVLIVDDEPLARRGIRNQLRQQNASIDVVAECSNGKEAVDAIRQHSPDLVFLDIQMPELGGFDVIQAIGVDKMPAVIFVTAYDSHALEAFEVHALDYLLKPVDADRFRGAFDRALDQLQRDDLHGKLNAVLRHLELTEKRPWRERFLIKEAGRISFVSADEVSWIDTAGNYIRLHIGSRTKLLRGTMEATAKELDPEKFVRIRRSTLVHVEAIKEFHTLSKSTYKVVLHDGTELTSSRNYRENLDKLFQRSS